MPLFMVEAESMLVPVKRVSPGPDLYEKEVEDLFWNNLEEFTGEALFPVARQPKISIGGRPDVVALDEDGRVVVVEVKRDMDRVQLSQCLEYAGWARTASLDELAGIYQAGPDQFFEDWTAFTETGAPAIINPFPRLILIAREIHGRTEAALEFLIENGLPIDVITVSIYEDAASKRFIDISGDHEPQVIAQASPTNAVRAENWKVLFKARRLTLLDLVEAGYLVVGEELVWTRPKIGTRYTATVTDQGSLLFADGSEFFSPSAAAARVANLVAYDGWVAWRVPRLDNILINELRHKLIAAEALEPDDLV